MHGIARIHRAVAPRGLVLVVALGLVSAACASARIRNGVYLDRAKGGKVAGGEGTIGALLADPTVYEDLTALLEGAQRSWLLRWAIRRTLDSGRSARPAAPEREAVRNPARP